MNMKMTARIALEMLEHAVLSALMHQKRWSSGIQEGTLPPAEISRKLGIPPDRGGVFSCAGHVPTSRRQSEICLLGQR